MLCQVEFTHIVVLILWVICQESGHSVLCITVQKLYGAHCCVVNGIALQNGFRVSVGLHCTVKMFLCRTVFTLGEQLIAKPVLRILIVSQQGFLCKTTLQVHQQNQRYQNQIFYLHNREC